MPTLFDQALLLLFDAQFPTPSFPHLVEICGIRCLFLLLSLRSEEDFFTLICGETSRLFRNMAEILIPSVHYIHIKFGLQTCNKSLLLVMLSPLPAALHQHPTRYQTRPCSGRIHRGHLIFMESPFSQRVEGPTLLPLPPEERLLRRRSSAEGKPTPGRKEEEEEEEIPRRRRQRAFPFSKKRSFRGKLFLLKRHFSSECSLATSKSIVES